jgi:putative tryptophan/tyrosine transport system permease protein
MGILLAMQGAVSQGVLWGIMTLGVYLTFRILNIPDMTCDGSFALGGSACAVLLAHGIDPVFALLVSFCAGMIAGLVTGLLHTKLKIHEILAGILTMIALYSINIRVMGKANTPLLGVSTLMSRIQSMSGFSGTVASLFTGILFGIVIIFILYWFFGTELGSALRATGNNEHMVRALGVDTDFMKILGLMLSNGLIAVSGALVAQSQGYADVGMGTGTIVIGLASIIIGEVVFGKRIAFWYYLASVVLGSIIYRIIIAVVLQLGMKSTDLKLLTAVIVALALAIPVLKKRMIHRRNPNVLPGSSPDDEETAEERGKTDDPGSPDVTDKERL